LPVNGHTDNSGIPAHNLNLSKQRAEAAKEQLVNIGISEDRLSTKGLGDTVPLSGNAKSRRHGKQLPGRVCAPIRLALVCTENQILVSISFFCAAIMAHIDYAAAGLAALVHA